MNKNRRMQCNRQGARAGFSHTGGATSSLPVWRRIAGSGDAAPPGGLCASRLADGEVGRVGHV